MKEGEKRLQKVELNFIFSSIKCLCGQKTALKKLIADGRRRRKRRNNKNIQDIKITPHVH